MYQKYTIGRNPDNNIIVPHPSVSGYHADLIFNDSTGEGQYVYIDHSTNGTLVNGQWVKNSSCIVTVNDTIVLAGCVVFDWSAFGYFNKPQPINSNPSAHQYAGEYNGASKNAFSQNSDSRISEDITFVGALKSFFNKYVDFKGRATRREFWFMFLWMLIFSTALSLITVPFSISSSLGALGLLELDDFDISAFWSALSGLGWCLTLYSVYELVMIIPSLSLLVRRIHDTGKDGLWILMLLVPFANIVFFFIWTLTSSEPRPNKWGN